MFTLVLACIALYVVVKFSWIVFQVRKNRKKYKHNFQSSSERKQNVKCMVVLGSGGHTAEMLRLTGALNFKQYYPRLYVIALSDRMSVQKLIALEKEKQYEVSYIPRSREVKQSWISTVVSTLYASIYSFPLVFKKRPDLLLVNGPGTCIPICCAAFLLTVLGKKVDIVFVESICRVTSMSLSGKILYYFADHLIVQWPELHQKYPETLYMGRIV